MRVSAAGGPVEVLTVPDSAKGEVHLWPHVLPGSKAVLFSVVTGDIGSAELAVVSVKDKTVRKLGVLGVNSRYVSTGHIVFGRVDAAAAFAVPFDLPRLRVTGPTVAVLEGVTVKGGGATELSLSNDGSLLMVLGSTGSRIAILDEKRRVTELSTDVKSRAQSPRFSPDGKRIAMSLRQTTS